MPERYEIRIEGHLASHWSTWLDDWQIEYDDDGCSRLIGSVADQAALHGLLVKLRDLGVSILLVARQDHLGRDRS